MWRISDREGIIAAGGVGKILESMGQTGFEQGAIAAAVVGNGWGQGGLGKQSAEVVNRNIRLRFE